MRNGNDEAIGADAVARTLGKGTVPVVDLSDTLIEGGLGHAEGPLWQVTTLGSRL
jgi:hypothetical protein